MFSEVEVALPPHIASLDVMVPGSVADVLDHAVRAIGFLEAVGAAQLAPLGSLLLRTESIASSKLEHIKADVSDYFRAAHGSRANPSAVAMVAATDALELLVGSVTVGGALNLDDVLRSHRELMRNDDAEKSYAGRVRDVQNWIGGSDYSPRNALFVPPPPELVGLYLDDLVTFVNRTDIPALVQAALAHAQFESIHPFTDGNGRIGRALVNTVLRRRGMTRSVVVPMASAIAARRTEYFDALGAYRVGDALPIVAMFASAAHLAAEESRLAADRLADLPREWIETLGRVRTGGPVEQLLAALPASPVIAADDAQRLIGGLSSTAYSSISRLAEAGVLVPLTDRQRNQLWGAAHVLEELDDLDDRIATRARAGL